MQEIPQTFFARPRLGGIQFPDFLEATELMDSCYRTLIYIYIDGIQHDWSCCCCLFSVHCVTLDISGTKFTNSFKKFIGCTWKTSQWLIFAEGKYLRWLAQEMF